MPRDPRRLALDRPNPRTAQLNKVALPQGMRIRIRRRQLRRYIGAIERKRDEDGGSCGESLVLREIERRGVGVEFEFVGPVAAGGGGGCVGDVFGVEKGDQEGGGPAGTED